MIRYTSDKNIFITYDKRSDKYWTELSKLVKGKFGDGPFESSKIIREILMFSYGWCADKFVEIIHKRNDLNFVRYIFAHHEASIKLWVRTLKGENLKEKEDISESDLSLNRRILKLALEQTCDVGYTNAEKINRQLVNGYIADVEDLMYLGSQLYGLAEHMAEIRMMEDPILISFNPDNILEIERKHHYDELIDKTSPLLYEGFKKGIFNEDIVKELKTKVTECFGIDYDFAGGQIFHIKEKLNPEEPKFQTIQPHVLSENLVANGASKGLADTFYEGLTISRKTKLPIKESVYQSHSMERYMFRPILILNSNHEERALVGIEKWTESITVMATNGFQWQQAPKEWLKIECFRKYLDEKADEHDNFLEDEVEAILKEFGFPFLRNVVSFTDKKKVTVRIDKPGIGEMDFIFVDTIAKRIIVSDCKYLRAKYEMVGFSRDYTNFVNEYEPKIKAKTDWVLANLQLVKEHFEEAYAGFELKIEEYSVESLFIINTPTFYMLNGNYKTIPASHLKQFIKENYSFPSYEVTAYSPGGNIRKKIEYPYFRVQ